MEEKIETVFVCAIKCKDHNDYLFIMQTRELAEKAIEYYKNLYNNNDLDIVIYEEVLHKNMNWFI